MLRKKAPLEREFRVEGRNNIVNRDSSGPRASMTLTIHKGVSAENRPRTMNEQSLPGTDTQSPYRVVAPAKFSSRRAGAHATTGVVAIGDLDIFSVPLLAPSALPNRYIASAGSGDSRRISTLIWTLFPFKRLSPFAFSERERR